jgi:hypothetical protein
MKKDDGSEGCDEEGRRDGEGYEKDDGTKKN